MDIIISSPNQPKRFSSDIDIDFPNRDLALAALKATTAASIHRDGKLVRHNTGVYVTDIPQDPVTGQSNLDYNQAESRGYTKLDFLNVSLYTKVRDHAHLTDLLSTEPAWDRLYDPEFCGQLTHIGNHYSTLISMPQAVNTIARMAMFLAIIRPAKRHLIGLPWDQVAKTIWDKDESTYAFKKSHSISYSHLVVVHMNLLSEAQCAE
jgi:hypothetical protein